MNENYLKLVAMIERLHRLFLEVIKTELNQINVRDITNVQCLILYNIGRDHVAIGDLTSRGYYLGSNVSYNSQKMIQNGYLLQNISSNDRRSVHVGLSEKGIELYEKLHKIFATQANKLDLAGADGESIIDLCDRLSALEKFWVSLQS
ncbi:MAG: MarR family winged helix-turn-helix transcriptional regulator [Candidatus Paracaedibacter sp.]